MAVGFQVTKASLDQRVGSIVVAGEAWFEDVQRQAAWLAAQPDADITALGYTSEDVALVKSSFVDLENLRLTAYGQRTQSPASNFFFWASKLRGIL
jgi:hypothetical protein